MVLFFKASEKCDKYFNCIFHIALKYLRCLRLHNPSTQKENILSKILSAFFFTSVLIATPFAAASSPADQRNIERIVNGGSYSIKDASEDIYRSGGNNPEVLDILSEVLLRNYKKSDSEYVDALSWACKALGNSNQARYRDTLTEVAQNADHRKLRKYASNALNQLPKTEASQYVKGSASIAKIDTSRNAEIETATVRKPENTQAANEGKKGTLQPISEIKKGMSMDTVYALAGPPDATTSRETGKRWIPFNFKGGDIRRTEALYKGQGRVVFSNTDQYSNNWRVLEVHLNPEESAYP